MLVEMGSSSPNRGEHSKHVGNLASPAKYKNRVNRGDNKTYLKPPPREVHQISRHHIDTPQGVDPFWKTNTNTYQVYASIHRDKLETKKTVTNHIDTSLSIYNSLPYIKIKINISYNHTLKTVPTNYGIITSLPIGSIYAIFAYIWLKFKVHVGKYTSPMEHLAYRNNDIVTNPIGTSESSNPLDVTLNPSARCKHCDPHWIHPCLVKVKGLHGEGEVGKNHMSHEKNNLLLSMEYCLVSRDPDKINYNPYITG